MAEAQQTPHLQMLRPVARRQTSAGVDWSGWFPAPRDEENPELLSLQQRMLVYRRMRFDSVIAEMVRVVETTAAAASWSVYPAEGAPPEVVAQCRRQFGLDGEPLVEGAMPWRRALALLVEGAFDGVHVLERVPIARWQDGGVRHYVVLFDVDATSYYGWARPCGVVEGMIQRVVSGSPVPMQPVSLDRLVVATWGKRGDDPEGEGILRSCYWAWMQKREILRSLAVATDRLGMPIPIIEADVEYLRDTAGYTDEQIDTQVGALYEQAQAMRASEASALKTIKGISLSTYAGMGSLDIAQYRSVVEMCDEHIAAAGGVRFLRLGVSDAGARNVGEVHEGVFRRSVVAILDWVCEVIREQVFMPILRLTWGEADAVRWCPTLRHEGLQTSRLEQMLPVLGQTMTGLDLTGEEKRRLSVAVVDAIEGKPSQGTR